MANAIVMTQQAMDWDKAGNLISTTAKQRFDTAVGNGELGTPSIEPKARVSYQASYPDALGRTIATADYGTNGAAAWTRPQTVPDPSDTVLVSISTYNTAGDLVVATNPAGVVTESTFDQAGRLVIVVENATGGSGNTRTTRYEYADDNGLRVVWTPGPSLRVGKKLRVDLRVKIQADARRTARFDTIGHTPGAVDVAGLLAEIAQERWKAR